MRTCERKMIDLIKQYRTGSAGGNTIVSRGQADNNATGCSRVYLHGHHIATVYDDGRPVMFTLAGYPTVTTRSRVNAILREFGEGAGVYQRRGSQYATCPRFGVRDGAEREISATEWVMA